MDNWNTYNPENIMTFNNIHIDHIKPISRFNLHLWTFKTPIFNLFLKIIILYLYFYFIKV